MKFVGEQILLRVYLSSTDKHGWQTAAEALVERARKDDLAGATLLRGLYGLDFAGKRLDGGAWSIVQAVPVIVEIVDRADKIMPFLAAVEEIVPAAVASLERAHVMRYRHRGQESAEPLPGKLPAPIVNLSTVPCDKDLPMTTSSADGQLLRVFIGESDQHEGKPLHRAIVDKAQELGLAGATVLRGAMGFGAASRIHTNRLLELSSDLPIVIEIVDSAEKIESLLPLLENIVQEGMITVESVRVLRYGRRDHAS
jgi:PII-like signaling protein